MRREKGEGVEKSGPDGPQTGAGVTFSENPVSREGSNPGDALDGQAAQSPMASARGIRDVERTAVDRLREACQPREPYPHDILSGGGDGLGVALGGGWREVVAKVDCGPGLYRFDRRYLPPDFPAFGHTVDVMGDDLAHVRRLLAAYLLPSLASDLASVDLAAVPMGDIWPTAFKPTRICRRRNRNR